MRILAALVLLALSSLALAQVPGTIVLDWTLPTTGCSAGVTPCDNKPLTGAAALTAIEVYISTSPIADTSTMAPTLTLAAGTVTTNHTMQVASGSTLYARVKAVNGAGKGNFSAQVSKAVTVPVLPGVPTNVTITLQLS